MTAFQFLIEADGIDGAFFADRTIAAATRGLRADVSVELEPFIEAGVVETRSDNLPEIGNVSFYRIAR